MLWALPPALAADARFLSLAARKENEDALEALVASWAKHYIASDLELLLQQAGIPAHQVVGSEDFMADPQLAARGHFVKLDHPLMGQATVEASRYQLSGTPATYVRSAPVYGRDNAHVLRDLLGYDDAHIARLDEAWQEERWGVDYEAADRTAARLEEALLLERWFRAL